MSGQRLKNEESDLGPTYIAADFMGSQSPRGKVGRSTMAELHLSCALRGVHISMGKFQSGFLKKHIIFPGCICFPDYKNIRVEFFDPGK